MLETTSMVRPQKCMNPITSTYSKNLMSYLCISPGIWSVFTPYLPYIALISVFCLTDGAARILPWFLSFYLPRDKYSRWSTWQQALWERVHKAWVPERIGALNFFLIWAHTGLFLVFIHSRSFCINESHHNLTINRTFPHLDKVGFDSGLISAYGRESWVGVTVASWLYKTERLPSHVGNLSTRCPVDAQWSLSERSWLGMFEGEVEAGQITMVKLQFVNQLLIDNCG